MAENRPFEKTSRIDRVDGLVFGNQIDPFLGSRGPAGF